MRDSSGTILTIACLVGFCLFAAWVGGSFKAAQRRSQTAQLEAKVAAAEATAAKYKAQTAKANVDLAQVKAELAQANADLARVKDELADAHALVKVQTRAMVDLRQEAIDRMDKLKQQIAVLEKKLAEKVKQ